MKRQKKYKTHKLAKKNVLTRNVSVYLFMFKKAVNNANRNPLDTNLTKESSEKLKEFKKICKRQQSSFWKTRNNELRDSENDPFCNIWKNCDRSTASIKDPKGVRNITQTFLAILTKGIKPLPKNNLKENMKR